MTTPDPTAPATTGPTENPAVENPVPALVHAAVTEDVLDAVTAERAVAHPACGAGVVFRGVIRDHDSGRTDVTALEYTGHPDADAIMRAVVERVAAAHPGVRVHAVHRLGDLRIGDDALIVAVAAAHRREAFACCAAVVDAVKADVPIWKRQDYASGDHAWVGLQE